MGWLGVTGGTGSVIEVYRCPANGRSLFKQADEDIQTIAPGRTWEPGELRNLMLEEASGWFNEGADEIGEGDALALIRSWSRSPPSAGGRGGKTL